MGKYRDSGNSTTDKKLKIGLFHRYRIVYRGCFDEHVGFGKWKINSDTLFLTEKFTKGHPLPYLYKRKVTVDAEAQKYIKTKFELVSIGSRTKYSTKKDKKRLMKKKLIELKDNKKEY